MNLTKGFARLNGERQVSKDSVRQAEQIFLESIRTLVADEGWKLDEGWSESHRLVDYSFTIRNWLMIMNMEVYR